MLSISGHIVADYLSVDELLFKTFNTDYYVAHSEPTCFSESFKDALNKSGLFSLELIYCTAYYIVPLSVYFCKKHLQRAQSLITIPLGGFYVHLRRDSTAKE